MIRAVIFDMDGVLIDSEPVYAGWLEAFLRKNHVEVADSELRKVAGMSSQNFKKKLQSWWTAGGKPYMSGDDIEKMFEKYCDGFPLSFKEIMEPYAEEVMVWLKEANCKIAVASSSAMDDIRKVLKETGLYKYVDVKVSGEMFANSKPDPQIYQFTVEQLGLEARECIAVEDSAYGIQAASRAGVRVIAKKDDRFGYDQSLADHFATNLHEVIDMIKMENEKGERDFL